MYLRIMNSGQAEACLSKDGQVGADLGKQGQAGAGLGKFELAQCSHCFLPPMYFVQYLCEWNELCESLTDR